jgi:hypothetical protein
VATRPDEPTLTVISWRDIPSQVIAREGRRTAKAMLGPRFQAAVDQAATLAGLSEMDAYIAEWRRTGRPCGADLESEVAAEVARIEQQYPRARLAALAAGLGIAVEGDARPGSSPAPQTTEAP